MPPRFSIPPSNHEVMPGGSVNLTCVAVGAPMPYVKWISGELELTREEEMPIGRNVLELTNIRQSANYTCVAVSSLGVIETTAQICVKGQDMRWERALRLAAARTLELAAEPDPASAPEPRWGRSFTPGSHQMRCVSIRRVWTDGACQNKSSRI